MSEPTSVYLYYDKLGVLLYVGITKRGTSRQQEHNELAEWWPFVAKQEIEHYDSRPEALARETMLIKGRRPPFNRQQNCDHQKLRAAYLTLFAPHADLSIEPWRCGHCGTCRHQEDGPCQLDPGSATHEPGIVCEICGSLGCAYGAGKEVGSQEGWSLATNLYKDQQKAPCGHCTNCEEGGGEECSVLTGKWGGEDREPCETCGRKDCLYDYGTSVGRLAGVYEGAYSANQVGSYIRDFLEFTSARDTGEIGVRATETLAGLKYFRGMLAAANANVGSQALCGAFDAILAEPSESSEIETEPA